MVRKDINLAHDILEDIKQRKKKGFKLSTWIQERYRQEFMTVVGINKQIAANRAHQEKLKEQESKLIEQIQKQIQKAELTYKNLNLKAKQFLKDYHLLIQRNASDYALFNRFCREFKEIEYEEFQMLIKIHKEHLGGDE